MTGEQVRDWLWAAALKIEEGAPDPANPMTGTSAEFRGFVDLLNQLEYHGKMPQVDAPSATFADLHDEDATLRDEVERLRLTVERLGDENERLHNERRYALERLVRAEEAIKQHHQSVTEKGFSSEEDRALWAVVSA